MVWYAHSDDINCKPFYEHILRRITSIMTTLNIEYYMKKQKNNMS